MNCLTDVLFYKDKLGVQNVIEGYKNIMNIPNVGERVMISENCYKVIERLFDFDGNIVHIVVEKVRPRFIKGG